MLTETNSFDYKTLLKLASSFKELFPFAEISALGQTWCKRDIISFSLGSGEKNVLFLGGVDGNDRTTPAMLLRFFERLCISYKNDMKISAIRTRNIFENQRITVIPMLNVDGQEISQNGFLKADNFIGLVKRANNSNDYFNWCANARGVEISRNFDFKFTKLNDYPAPFGYCGPKKESELESQAIASLCDKEKIKYSILFSANSEKIIYSNNSSNSDNTLMAQIFKSISEFETLERSKEDEKGNFCEWFLHKYDSPSIEFSFKNINPFSLEEFDEAYRKYEELLMLSAIM